MSDNLVCDDKLHRLVSNKQYCRLFLKNHYQNRSY